MITSDGRSIIEAEMEQMRFTALDLGEKRLKVDCRDHSLPDSADTSEYNYPPEPSFSFISRLFTRIFSPIHA
jgi:hypothetical protein